MPDVDVLIIGAGLSGIGAACHLEIQRPGTTYAIVEARATIGGTWDLFRYPGIRSDSDMFTLGYSFEPWRGGHAIAEGPDILDYIRSTASRHGVDRHITFGCRALSAAWSTSEACWSVEIEELATGERRRTTCRFLWSTTGYYRYDQGYRPEFGDQDSFDGIFVHPQHWPEDLDWQGKQVVVIGSGATAVTLVPALAESAAHVTMLQRSPTYIVSRPRDDKVANRLRSALPARTAHALIRWKNVLTTQLSYVVSRRWPEVIKKGIRKGVVEALPEGYDVETDFTPSYNPWDQRLCLVPDGDLFEAITQGRASVVTDTIERFVPEGIVLKSGAVLPADIVVTATGLVMELFGGMTLEVDGHAVQPGETVGYKGIMLCGVPNMASTFGYTNASWTLKADLTAEYVCRLLEAMERRGLRQCTPLPPDPTAPTEPFIDFSSGYVTRAQASLPRQGTTLPWRLHQSYLRDIMLLRHASLDDHLVFSNPMQYPALHR